METQVFLTAFATVLAVAALTTVLFERLRQPVVLGYILAGLIVGPYLPIPLVADTRVVHTLSELGVILLLFSLGLEFSIRKLFQVGPTAGLTAVIQCGLMLWLGYLTGRLLGWSRMECLFLGSAIAVSSTTIIAKAFEDKGITGRLRDLVVGILIVEDLISVLMIAALTVLASSGEITFNALAFTSGRLALFLVAALILGLLLVPAMINYIDRLGRSEIMVVTVVGLCFLFSLGAMKAGYSVALGAFLAGSLVAESGKGLKIEEMISPLKNVFAAVFFVSVGMMLDPAQVKAHWPAVLVITVLVIGGKFLSVSIGALLTGNGVRTSTQAGMSMAQVGEFSFIIAGVGLALNATGSFLYPVTVAVAAVTTLTTPYMIGLSGSLAELIDRKLPKRLQTFSALYANWSERLGQSPEKELVRKRVISLGRRMLLDAAAILLVAIMGEAFFKEITGWLEGLMGQMPIPWKISSRVAITVLAFLLALPFVLGIIRLTQALGRLLADQVFPPRQENQLDLAAAPRRAMVAAIQLFCVLLVGIPLLAITQPFTNGWQGGAVLLAFVVFLGWSFWRHAADLHGHVRAGSELLAEALSKRLPQTGQPLDDPAGLPDVLPGLGNPVPVHLPAGCPALGKTLAQLNLRGATGATALAIIHADGKPTAAQAHAPLAEGDTLVLSGPSSSLDSAEALLLGEKSVDNEDESESAAPPS